MTASIAIVAAPPAPPVDGIWDYSVRLAAALEERQDATARLCAIVRRVEGQAEVEGAATIVGALPSEADAVVLQYNPFSFARWGFAPWLAGRTSRLRMRRRRPIVGLMVHEPYVPMTSWRWRLMGAWQRGQLSALRAAADVVLVAIESWADALTTRRPHRPTHHVPVGSALPDMRPDREAQRARLGVAEDAIVLTVFGTRHPTRLSSLVERSARAVARDGRAVCVLNLGAGAPPLAGLHGEVDVRSPGRLENAEVARWLSAGDIYLAPFLDGVSTRRTTLMAALQHGLPVVGTEGPLTDGVLRDASEALRLVPVADESAFAQAVVALAADPRERSALSARARELFDARFSWPRIADRVLTALGLGGATPARGGR